MSYRLALVEYLNTYPFSKGIRLNGLDTKLEVHRVIPSLCAQLFEERRVDISLCPVGALTDMPDYEIRGKYCIGADGKVDTVMLLSNVPVEEIKEVRLDDHSRTSNILLQILAKKYWNKDWKYFFSTDTSLPESCLMIGDKVFEHRSSYKHAYDLAETWKFMTGLPMVFAVWITVPGVPESIMDELDHAFKSGMADLGKDPDLDDWKKDYLLNRISYPFDENKMKALKLFQSFAGEL